MIAMKTIQLFFLGIFFLFGYQEHKKEASENPTTITQETFNGATQLTLNGQAYDYDDIDWNKSRVFYDEGVWVALRQEDKPEIIFSFPTIERYSALGRHDFKMPEFNQVDGREPITLYFVQRLDTVWFHKGKIKASLKSKLLNVSFEGIGRGNEKGRSEIPVSGHFNVTIQ